MDFVHNPYRCGPLRVGMYEVGLRGGVSALSFSTGYCCLAVWI